MNISFAEKKDNYARISLAVTEEDYSEKVDKQIKKLSRTASIPGFRKGNVPAGMIRKMYGKEVKGDVINKLISDSLYEFMQKESLRPLGQPIPTRECLEMDILEQGDFTYSFEVSLRPPITELLTKEDKFDLYKVITTDEMIEQMLQSSLKSAGKMEQMDTVTDDSVLTGSVYELEGDLPKENGIRVEKEAMLLVNYIKNEEEKAKFVGTPKNSVVVFRPYEAFEGNKAELTSLLRVDAEQVDSLQGKEFSFQIDEIKAHKNAELGQEFYDTVFGKDAVKTEQEARQKIREYSEARTLPDTNMKFLEDLKQYIRTHKIDKIDLDTETLKRWYLTTEEFTKLSSEDFDATFARMIEDLKVELYMNALQEKYNIDVKEEDVQEFAKEMTRMQFSQYGLQGIAEEVIEKYSSEMLQKGNTRQRIVSTILDQKTAAEVQKDVTIEEKQLSVEDFNKLVNPSSESGDTHVDEDPTKDA